MSTPLIWIVIPLLVAMFLIPLHTKPKLSTFISCIVSFSLFLLAIIFPKDLVILFGDNRYEVADQIILLSRTISIPASSLTLVALLFLINFFWNLGNAYFKSSIWFNFLSLLITILWITAFSIKPFLYTTVVVELIALLSVPILSPRGEKTSRGVLIYLIFQTIAIPLILLSGWMLSGIGAVPSASPLIFRASVMIAVGFILWLGAFPFHSWVPMLCESSHPWIISYLLSLLQTSVVVFFLNFLDQYSWLRNLPNLFESLRIIGAVTVMLAGLFSSIQSKLTRYFGYLFLAETGYSILSIGLLPNGGLNYLAMSLLIRGLSYWLWGWSLSSLRKLQTKNNFGDESIRGLSLKFPVTSIGIIASFLSLIGLPLLPAFPVKQMLWFLTLKQDMNLLIFLAVGLIGMLIALYRFLRLFLQSSDQQQQEISTAKETSGITIPVITALLLFLFIGIAPNIFLTPLIRIIEAFTHLIP